MGNLSAHLQELEERLFDPAVRASKVSLQTLLSPDFREIGASGRPYGFQEICLALSAPENTVSRSLHDFSVVLLSDGVALATYRATRQEADGTRVESLRSSIWRNDGVEGWRMVFHQGTLTS